MCPVRRSRWRGAGGTVACLAAIVATGTGCGSASEQAAGEAARAFERALAEGEAGRACSLLSGRARSELELSTGRPCSETILDEGRRDAGEARDVSVFGTAAQAVFDGDTVFLSRFEEGWRVTAAACSPTPAGLYDCLISGG